MKMSTIVGIFIFISREISSLVKMSTKTVAWSISVTSKKVLGAFMDSNSSNSIFDNCSVGLSSVNLSRKRAFIARLCHYCSGVS